MPITRTIIVDDSGAGTDGTVIDNAWKQEFYDQIDAALAVVTVVNLHDTSGAGLGILGQAVCIKAGRVVTVQGQAAYPPTAHGAAASFGGLPWLNTLFKPGGMYIIYGPPNVLHITQGADAILVLNAASMAARTNAELSGANVSFAGVYITD